jgi:hypothetical protein
LGNNETSTVFHNNLAYPGLSGPDTLVLEPMSKIPRIIFITGSLSLLLVFSAPIWRITLEAPQYPDGVTMYIWINKLGGKTKGTLQNINILNHYVGMKPIDAGSIPELKYFPLVIIIMSLLGVIAGYVNKPVFWIAWLIILIILGMFGIYDFYLWEYDYGHNLAEDAPIKVPGMVYQPPLIGSKKLLNFNAISYPHWGSLFIVIPIILGFLAYFLDRQKKL